jgi:outer membrane protein
MRRAGCRCLAMALAASLWGLGAPREARAQAEATPSLSLSEALSTALEHNPRVAQARAAVLARGAEVGIARGVFDTSLRASVEGGLTRRPTPDLVSGVLEERSVAGSVGYAHRLEAGTGVGVSLVHRYADSAGILTVLAPQFASELRVSASQPVLRGFGSDVTLARVRGASTREEAARLQLLRTAELVAAGVAQAYWSVAQVREEVALRRRVFERAERTLELTQALIKQGSLAPAALAQATSTRALRKARLEASERLLRSAEAELARAILDRTPQRVDARESLPEPGAVSPVVALERADVKALELLVAAQGQEVVASDDEARPSLDLSVFAGLTGLGGTRNSVACQLFTQGAGAPPAGCVDGGGFDGYGKAWSSLVTGGFYTAGVAASLALPVINEGARSRAALARISVEQTRLGAESLKRDAEVEALFARQLAIADREAYETAKAARVATQQLVEVEEQRYRVGSSTTFDVLRVQDDLAEAESAAITAQAAVLLSDVRYGLATGHLLAQLGVRVEP